MNRRPWPIVLMAILQFISPVLYLVAYAIANSISLGSATNEILALTAPLRQLEIFILPIIFGALILYTRKFGYYIVVAGTVYLIIRGVQVFSASNETDPILPVILSNLVCLIAVVTLLRAKARAVYFNPRLRWWETSPRYVVDITASVTRVGASPMKADLHNVAVGGAGLETLAAGFLTNEIISLEFQHEGEVFKLKSKVVWEKVISGGKQYLGVQWADDNANSDWSKLRRLVRGLKTKHVPTTRKLPPRLADVREWFGKIAG